MLLLFLYTASRPRWFTFNLCCCFENTIKTKLFLNLAPLCLAHNTDNLLTKNTDSKVSKFPSLPCLVRPPLGHSSKSNKFILHPQTLILQEQPQHYSSLSNYLHHINTSPHVFQQFWMHCYLLRAPAFHTPLFDCTKPTVHLIKLLTTYFSTPAHLLLLKAV
jgi:hypothetical protein